MMEFHLIARFYHWERYTIKTMPSRERHKWVEKIIEHEKAKAEAIPDDD